MNDFDLNAAIAQVVERSRQRIPAWIAEHAKRAEPAYCLCLSYNHAGDAVLAPPLAVGYDSTRTARAARYSIEEQADLYLAPAEMDEDHDDLEAIYGKEMVELEYRIEAHILESGDTEDDEDEVDHEELMALRRRPLLHLVRTLSELDWSTYRSVTDDFFVYASDVQQYHTCANLRVTDRALFERLQAARLLPEDFEWAAIDLD